jgi:hypothetical protein
MMKAVEILMALSIMPTFFFILQMFNLYDVKFTLTDCKICHYCQSYGIGLENVSAQRTADSGQRTAVSGQRTADSGQPIADSR